MFSWNKKSEPIDHPRLEQEPDNRFGNQTLLGKGVPIVCPSCGIKEGCVLTGKLERVPLLPGSGVAMVISLSCKYCQSELVGVFPDDKRTIGTIVEILSLMNDWFPAVSRATAEFFERQHKQRGGLLS